MNICIKESVVPQFSGKRDDFILWTRKFLAYSHSRRLRKTFLGEENVDDMEKQYDAYSLLVQALDNKSLLLLEDDCEGNGCKSWKTLQDNYSNKSEARIMSLWERLNNVKCKSPQEMSDYVLKVEMIAREIKASGAILDERFIVSATLKGLPTEYKYLDFMQVSSGEPLTFAKVKRFLLQQADSDKLNEVKEEQALITKNYNKHFNKRHSQNKSYPDNDRKANNSQCYFCKKTGHIRKHCYIRQGWTCESCGIKGHSKQECNKKGKCNENFRKNPEKNNQIYGLCVTKDNWDKENCFVIDSGCSKHMVKDRAMFETFDSYSNSVKIANGMDMEVKGKGIVKAMVRDKMNNLIQINLEAFHVPDLTVNLLSVRCLKEKQHSVIITPQVQHLILFDGRTVQLTESGNLFYLNLEKPAEQCYSTTANDKAGLWHRRMGHISEGIMRSTVGVGFNVERCSVCQTCKQDRKPIKQVPTNLGKAPLYRVYSDVLSLEESKFGYKYLVGFIDEYSRYIQVYPIKKKSDVLGKFKEYIQNVGKPCILRSDNGGEFKGEIFKQFCINCRIRQEFSAPYTPQQNGMIERSWRTLMNMIRCILQTANLPKILWPRAALTAAYLRNRSVVRDGCTPYELLKGRKPELKHIRVFGCRAYLHIEKYQRSKLDKKAKTVIFVGYSDECKAYVVYDPEQNSMHTSRNVTFDEINFPGIDSIKNKIDLNIELQRAESLVEIPAVSVQGNQEQQQEINNDTDPIYQNEQQVNDAPIDSSVRPSNEEFIWSDHEDKQLEPSPFLFKQPIEDKTDTRKSRAEEAELRFLDRLKRKRKPNQKYKDYQAYIADNGDKIDYEKLVEPTSFDEAICTNKRNKWMKAMEDEIKSLKEKGTWTVVARPRNKKVIKGKWVYKIKKDEYGNIEKYKARYVAKGFSQTPGEDYTETFSPTARQTTLRLLLALTIQKDLAIDQVDVNTAFLNAELEEELYIEQPKGFEVNGDNFVCLLHKGIYGLKQSSRRWHETLKEWLTAKGFTQSQFDSCLFYGPNTLDIIAILIYVDDMAIIGRSKRANDNFKIALHQKYRIDDKGKLKCFIGLNIEIEEEEVRIDQQHIVQELIGFQGMDSCNPCKIPMEPSTLLVSNENEKIAADDHQRYRSIVGVLNYLAINTRMDISYVTGELSRFLNKPTSQQLQCVKKVVRYLAGNPYLGIQFIRSNHPLRLIGYCDANYAACPETRRSTTGYCFKLEGVGMVSWASRRQRTVALSTTESEYMALAEACQEAKYLFSIAKEISTKMGLVLAEKVRLFGDNQSAIAIASNPIQHARTKHIDVRYHFVREVIKEGMVEVQYISTQNMKADMLTKALPLNKFMKCLEGLMVNCDRDA